MAGKSVCFKLIWIGFLSKINKKNLLQHRIRENPSKYETGLQEGAT